MPSVETVLDGTFLLGGVSETGLALVRLTAEGKSEELPLPDSTEYLYALCPDGAGGAWLLCGSLPKGYFDAFGNFRFLSKEPEGKLALAHYDAAFALQETVLLQTQYTDRFFQLCRLEGGFCMMSASLLICLDEAGAETSRQSLDAKDGWSFAAIQEADGVLYVLTRNFYSEELPELRKFAPDTLSALEADTCTSEVIGLGLCADGRLLMGNREELFAYDTGSGETEPLVRWQELGANVLAEQPWELEDGYLLFSPGDTSLQRLRRVPGQTPERTVLTLAVVCGDTPFGAFTQMLQDFNLSQDAYRICVTESRRAPLTFGVFRPTVLLPDDLPAGQPQFQLVLAHELAHIRRRDCLRKLLLIVCLCLYWWNPLVWIMVRLANRDMELACDEAVLRALGPACKKPYALALLDMAQRQTKPSPLCSSFAKSCAEERVRAILRFRRLPAWTGALTAVLFLLAAGVLATQAQTAARVPEAPAAMQEQAETPEAPVNQPVIHIDPVITPAPAAQEPEAEAPAYVWPLEDVDAAVTDAYGWTVHPLTQKESFHSGVDLEAEAGQNVLAVAAGTVLDCSYSEAYGYHVTLEHENGVQTMYAHLRAFYVESGDTVAQGQVIAAVGATGWATGPHLHLSVFRDGEAVDPLDALASALE